MKRYEPRAFADQRYMQEVDNGRYLDRDEVVNGRSIGEVQEMWERGELAIRTPTAQAEALAWLRERGWSHASDPVKGGRVKEKYNVVWKCEICHGTGYSFRPLTQAKALVMIGELAKLLRDVINNTGSIACDSLTVEIKERVKELEEKRQKWVDPLEL